MGVLIRAFYPYDGGMFFLGDDDSLAVVIFDGDKSLWLHQNRIITGGQAFSILAGKDSWDRKLLWDMSDLNDDQYLELLNWLKRERAWRRIEVVRRMRSRAYLRYFVGSCRGYGSGSVDIFQCMALDEGHAMDLFEAAFPGRDIDYMGRGGTLFDTIVDLSDVFSDLN